ncbi:MAG: polysaccharide chain length determinant protein (PEP-CTERM system associated) [Desulforhopalus sp.]|jgi:polysaccharide chain length determinant protein (PEP-CTERM system associated)
MQDLQKTIELLLDYLRGVWVKKRYVMLCSWLVCPAGFIYVASMPDVYESQARVYVDTRSVLQPLLRGLTIQTNPQQEIAMMVKTLLSRPNLEIIARESDLDISVTNPSDYESMIAGLSANIKFRAAGKDNLYTIAYTHDNPLTAKTVVQETLDLFVEGTHGNSRKDTDSANRFLEEQVGEYENRLAAAEQRLADFKRKYSDVLPNQGSFYQNYGTLEENLDQTKLTIKETQQKIKALTSQIDDQKNQYNDFSTTTPGSQTSLTTRYDSRIRGVEEKLDQAMLRYTDLHPDVMEAKNLLESLQKLRDKEIEEYLASNNNGVGTDEIGSISSELRLEVTRLKSLIASLEVRQADYQGKLNELKQKIDLVPQIEAENTSLNRDYGITKRKYEELLTRKESAELAQKADVSSEDVQFKVIDPPLASQKPSGPNRLIGYTVVIVLGFAAGLGLAFLISQLNPVLIRGSQLSALTSYPVLGVVSHLNKAQIKKTNRNRLIVFVFSSGLIFILYGALISAELLQLNLYARVFS